MYRRRALTQHHVSTSRCEVLDSWYDEFAGLLVGYLQRLTRSVHEAEDIAQEAFLHMLIAQISGPIRNPKAFLFTTALNILRDHCRLAHTRAMREAVPVDEAEIPDWCEASQIIESEQALALVVHTLKHLRPSTRKVFILDRVELRCHSEIAAQMGITVSMVEKHIRYAMDALEALGFEQPRHTGSRRGEVVERRQRINSVVDEAIADRWGSTLRRRKTVGRRHGCARRRIRQLPSSRSSEVAAP